MDPFIAACLGAVIASLVTLFACRMVDERRRRRAAAVAARTDPVADPRAIVEALSSAAALVGPHDEVLALNAAALADGVVRGDRIGLPPLLDGVRRARREQELVEESVEQDRSGRTARILESRAVPLALDHVFLVVDDRSHALRAEEAARDFLANATHELKTPIGAVTLLAEAIEQASDDEQAVAHFAARVQVEAVRLGQLVAQIIQLSRLLGGGGVRHDRVEVDDLLDRVLAFNRALADRRGVRLTSGPSTGLVILGDVDQLVSALNNLVQNAIAYSDREARVVVSARRSSERDGVALVVTDNGIGIPAAEVERIFERFYRVDYARSRENGGTGLGLSIVEEIVHAHGGDVTVWSQPGSGSTFTITLPAASDGPEATS